MKNTDPKVHISSTTVRKLKKIKRKIMNSIQTQHILEFYGERKRVWGASDDGSDRAALVRPQPPTGLSESVQWKAPLGRPLWLTPLLRVCEQAPWPQLWLWRLLPL